MKSVHVRVRWSAMLVFVMASTVMAWISLFDGASLVEAVWFGVGVSAGVSVLLVAHEVAHGVVARSAGWQWMSLTLFWGGAFVIVDAPDDVDPVVWSKVALVGPAVNLAAGAVLLVTGVSMLQIVGGLSVLVGVFNLIPVGATDGSQVFQVWRDATSVRSASRVAVHAGRWLVVAGVVVAGFMLGVHAGVLAVLTIVATTGSGAFIKLEPDSAE